MGKFDLDAASSSLKAMEEKLLALDGSLSCEKRSSSDNGYLLVLTIYKNIYKHKESKIVRICEMMELCLGVCLMQEVDKQLRDLSARAQQNLEAASRAAEDNVIPFHPISHMKPC